MMARGVYSRAVNLLGTDWPNANIAAVVTIAASAGELHDIRGIYVSYTAAPTGGNLLVVIGGTTVLDEDIFAAGVTPFVFAFADDEDGLHRAKNEAVVATLAAGGGGISGKLNVLYR